MPLDFEHKVEELEKSAGTSRGIWFLVLPLLRSRYFLISLAFYLSLLMIFAGYKISSYIAIRGSFDEGAVLVLPPLGPPPPPMPKQETKAETKDVKVNTTAATIKTAVTRITVTTPADFVRKETLTVMPVLKMAEVKVKTDMSKKIEGARIARLQGVAKFQKGWGVSGSKRSTKAKFTIFQAKYLDGDWYCNSDSTVGGPDVPMCGSLQNMMLQIRAWSRDRIDAQVVPEVLDIGTDKLFTLKPPFVYLTGHKDFRLADNEVKNLRDYLTLGGAIWADSALAGRRSRFDIAFRREMARVLPDRDFEIVPENHEMFDTFFDNIGLPTGMNNYHEQIEMINIGGKLAVLYTLNGYGHFWEARLNRDGKIEWYLANLAARGEKPIWRYVHGPHLYNPRSESGIIYRNVNDETTRNIYKFGINVVVHLLTRYQRDIMLLPKELPAGPDVKNRTSPLAGDGETVANVPASTNAIKAGASK
ncbi:MAG: DUF4159 domain-containing protein [Verrucomicrobia bacterium]|nr:DUF4159 domain-containing protein [Verrucomicrobiota bacterium]MBU1735642.1 DUF4159 domain-containing protein [Verrucomicrobiota bacterium]MBU1856694.1 DUF4159 domain-containing protein [Verrucomicrobiota bacterium]